MTKELTTRRESAPDLGEMMALAVQQGPAGVEALERLVALQERVDDKRNQSACIQALITARDGFPEIIKTREGQHSTRKGTRTVGNYAALEDIDRAVLPVLAENDLTRHWDRQKVDGDQYVVCYLTHKDGGQVSSKFPALIDEGRGRSAIQSVASGESYAKRYSLIAVLGITTADPDDDGQQAGRVECVSEEQAVKIIEALEVIDDKAYGQRFLRWAGSDDPYAIPADKFGEAMKALTSTIKKGSA